VSNIAELLGEPADQYRTVPDQLARKERLDDLLHEWIGQRSAEECLEQMAKLEVTASRIYTAQDIVNDPIYAEREDIVEIDDPDLGSVRMQGVVPKLGSRPGSVWRTGAALGQDNELVFRDWLGKTAEEFERLLESSVI
jgi:formyl-CoA transferase